MRIIALLLLPFFATAKVKTKVDLLVLANNIYTVDEGFNIVSAMAIKDGRIVATGTKELILDKYSAVNTIDYPNAHIYPGFIDAHCHFSGYALDAYKVDLVGTRSYEEVLERLSYYEETNKLDIIYGRGWDQNDWDIKEYPTKRELDERFPDKPVILKRIDGHAILSNQKALDMAGITAATNIQGGIIEVKDGALTGILIDNAMEPVEKLVQELPALVGTEYLLAMETRCYSEGLTGVVDCGVTKPVIQLLFKLYTNRKLSIGNSVLLSQDDETIGHYAKKGPFRKGQLQVNGIKMYADGALGSRGACLLHPYADLAGHKGMLLSSYEKFYELAKLSHRYKWQLCTHAIGDSANRTILNIYGYHLKGKNDRRWRIEHAQVVQKSDFMYFRDYSIVPSVQPTHAISDMPWAGTRLGSTRINDAYAYKSLLNTTGWIALGTDFPVEAISPIATFYTAVVRKNANGEPKHGFLAGNALSRQEALRGMTVWAAKSVFLEKEKGSLEVGKDADFVILDKDLMIANEDEILKTEVLKTFVNGELKYSK